MTIHDADKGFGVVIVTGHGSKDGDIMQATMGLQGLRMGLRMAVKARMGLQGTGLRMQARV